MRGKRLDGSECKEEIQEYKMEADVEMLVSHFFSNTVRSML